MKLGGWYRLGIVCTAMWFLALTVLTSIEYFSESRTGGVVVTWEQEKPKPWEIDWSKNPPIRGQVFDPDEYLRSKGMTQAQIDAMPYLPSWHWKAIGALFVGVPFLAWLGTYAMALAIRWIRQGFRDES